MPCCGRGVAWGGQLDRWLGVRLVGVHACASERVIRFLQGGRPGAEGMGGRGYGSWVARVRLVGCRWYWSLSLGFATAR